MNVLDLDETYICNKPIQKFYCHPKSIPALIIDFANLDEPIYDSTPINFNIVKAKNSKELILIRAKLFARIVFFDSFRIHELVVLIEEGWFFDWSKVMILIGF
jgi:hypothetical protein